MPIYEYQCRQCGEITDIRHGFEESNSAPCPKCGGELARRFSPTGIVFKGSGFYVTDSRKASTASPKASSTKSGTADAKPASGGDAAPASEAKPSSSGESSSGGSSTGSGGSSDGGGTKGEGTAA